ncbi:hypothetical protein AMTRI_Chr01g136680 [Amborella trichopoda]
MMEFTKNSHNEKRKRFFGSSSSYFSTLLGDVNSGVMLPKELELEKEGVLEFRIKLPDAREAMKGFLKNREVAEFVSGALAGAMTKAVLAPLETIRTRMVVGVGSKNIAGSFFEIVEQQGWQGLWAGNAVNMLRIIPTQAIELCTFECVNRAVSSAKAKYKLDNGQQKSWVDISLGLPLSWISPVAVGGAAAGIVSTLCCHPLEVLKDRITVNPEVYGDVRLALQKMSEEGFRGYYAGISPTLIGMLPYSTCYYYMYESIKKSYCGAKKKSSLNRAELIVIGALSGFTASTISFPLEVARKRLMVGGTRHTDIMGALSEVVREDGLKGLYRGWGASCLKVMPSSGITRMFYEAWKDILLMERRIPL